MSFEGIARGRRKAIATARIVHNGDGTSTLYRDDDIIGVTANLMITAWFQIDGAIAQKVNYIEIFDSTGEIMAIGTGAAGSEEFLFQVTPGGNGGIPLRIDGGTRLAIRLVSGGIEVAPGLFAPESNTETVINFYD